MRGQILTIRKAVYYGKYYENTHVEALEAKRMMDEQGLKSAMLVSSAYHMRRIALIAGRVFKAHRYSIFCNPVRWQATLFVRDYLNKERRMIIVSEYLKMCWFMVYGVFN